MTQKKAKTPQQIISNQMPGWKIADWPSLDTLIGKGVAEEALPSLDELRSKFLGSVATAPKPASKGRAVKPRGTKSNLDAESGKTTIYRVTKGVKGKKMEERVGIKDGKVILQTG